jgi:hypothetical protein
MINWMQGRIKMDNNIKVIAVVSGGILQSAYANIPIDLQVLDYDNFKKCDPEENKEEFEYYKELENQLREDIFSFKIMKLKLIY